MVRKYRVIRALHYTNLYKRGLASPRLPRASHNLKPPLPTSNNKTDPVHKSDGASKKETDSLQ